MVIVPVVFVVVERYLKTSALGRELERHERESSR
jgi:hypothetical protein